MKASTFTRAEYLKVVNQSSGIDKVKKRKFKIQTGRMSRTISRECIELLKHSESDKTLGSKRRTQGRRGTRAVIHSATLSVPPPDSVEETSSPIEISRDSTQYSHTVIDINYSNVMIVTTTCSPKACQ